MEARLKQILTKAEPGLIIEQKGKDIYIKSKDRETTKSKIEAAFKKNKIQFKSLFKKSKSSSLEVLELPGLYDIIFKPIIQKGAGGVDFEKTLKVDIQNYLNGVEHSKLKNSDVIKEMEKKLGFSRAIKYEIVHEGSMNKKRNLTFNGNMITINNNTGEVISDLTLRPPTKDPMYISLKMSKSYYVLSASVLEYFKNKNTKTKINEYFGFDGQQMIGFGKEFVCLTKRPNYNAVKRNLEDLLGQAIGTKVILIHKKQQNDVLVSKVGATNKVTISKLNDDSYTYPEQGVRKYANIKFEANINGTQYKVNCQFRGTTAADVGPKYLRILLER